jgi:hypothetical protein
MSQTDKRRRRQILPWPLLATVEQVSHARVDEACGGEGVSCRLLQRFELRPTPLERGQRRTRRARNIVQPESTLSQRKPHQL